LILAAAGGALGGYLIRARQDIRASRKHIAGADLIQAPHPKVLTARRSDPAAGLYQTRRAGETSFQDSDPR
jgi:hypothetical protein